MRNVLVSAAGLMALCLVLLAPSPYSRAEDKKAPAEKAPAEGEKNLPIEVGEAPDTPVTPVTEVDEIPVELDDAAFDRFVKLTAVREAIVRRNASALLDTALLVAEGERVLLRPRKGISAEQLFGMTLRLATESKDKDTLMRLAKAAKMRDDKDFGERVAAAIKFEAPTRSLDTRLSVNVEKTDLAVVAFIQECMTGIGEAELVGNVAALKALEDELPKVAELTDAQKKAIKARIDEAKKNMGKGDTEDPIGKLMAGSRGWKIGPIKGDWPPKIIKKPTDYSYLAVMPDPVVIRNATKINVAYAIDGTWQTRLGVNKTATFQTGSNSGNYQARTIRFENAKGKYLQYRLDSGTYTFKVYSGTLGIYKGN